MSEPFWTTERLQLAVMMWRDARPASEIGIKVGTTRNAVIGKMNRLGIPHGSTGEFVLPEPRAVKEKPLGEPAMVKVVVPEPEPEPPGILFLKVPATGRCKFPLWGDHEPVDISQKRVCGEPAPANVWCAHHMRRVAEPPRPSRKR